jgi:RimJ/RimL family protein N-acetyltransferase
MQAIRTDLIIRPITAGDRERLADAFERLSAASRYKRFLHPKNKLSDAELTYFTEVDHQRHEALVAVDPSDGSFVGVARYAALDGTCCTADLAFAVVDEWQGRGVATTLLRALLPRAEENGMTEFIALTLQENGPARKLLRRFGFRTVSSSHGISELRLELRRTLRIAA